MLTFAIEFHGPFHVGSGVPDQGLDRVLDRDALLPGTSLKGVMRAAASEILLLPDSIVTEVFGAKSQRGAPSPWWWSDAEFEAFEVQNLARIRIDHQTRTAARGFLMSGESIWAHSAAFEIVQKDRIDGGRNLHELVLRASARAVSGIGGGRRRGEGWVTIGDANPWSEQDTKTLMELR